MPRDVNPEGTKGRFGIFPLRIRTVSTLTALVACVISFIALGMLARIGDAIASNQKMHSSYSQISEIATDLVTCSDKLTSAARLYVAAGSESDLQEYLHELALLEQNSSRIIAIKPEYGGTKAYTNLFDANAATNSIARREMRAMRLAAEGRNVKDLPEEIESITLTDEQEALSDDEKLKAASDLLSGEQYRAAKDIIVSSVNECTTSLAEPMRAADQESAEILVGLFRGLSAIIIALLLIILLTLLVNFQLVVIPMVGYARSISQGEKLKLAGAHELRLVTTAYNEMYEDLHAKNQALAYEAEHDSLTGAMNRGSYDKLVEGNIEVAGLIIIDIDYFKQINDTYGHQAGDVTLRQVADSLRETFTDDAIVCRVGGDEFSLIVVNPNITRADIEWRIGLIRSKLAQPQKDMPRVTLSVGVAFNAGTESAADLYRAADKALYLVKQNGRNGIAFSGDRQVEVASDHTKEVNAQA